MCKHQVGSVTFTDTLFIVFLLNPVNEKEKKKKKKEKKKKKLT